MEYTIEPTDVEVKLGIDDLRTYELDIAYRRGYQEGRLSAKDLYEACKGVMDMPGDIQLTVEQALKVAPVMCAVREAIAKAEGKG